MSKEPDSKRQKTIQPKGKALYVLAGQSNMAGRGSVSELPNQYTKHPRIFRFSASQKWELAQEPMHADVDLKKTCGVGPGLVFATELLVLNQHVGHGIGLIPVAIGGTSLEEWRASGPLYAHMIKQTKAALASNAGNYIAGFLWYQGETDAAGPEELANSYNERFLSIYNSFQYTLVEEGHPNIPTLVVIVSGASPRFPYITTVRSQQQKVVLCCYK